MIKPVYAVRDLKAGFLPPFVDVNDDVAARGFTFAMTKAGTLEHSNIQDYQLFRIGDYDDNTGFLISDDKKLIVDGASLIKGDENV